MIDDRLYASPEVIERLKVVLMIAQRGPATQANRSVMVGLQAILDDLGGDTSPNDGLARAAIGALRFVWHTDARANLADALHMAPLSPDCRQALEIIR